MSSNAIDNVTLNQQEKHAGECPGPETTGIGFISVLELEGEMSNVSQLP